MRRPGWKLWLVIALVVGSMAFASWFAQGSGDLEFVHEVVARIEARVAAGEQRDRAVYGELVDGEAWRQYEQAYDIVGRYSASLDGLAKIEQWQSGDDDPEVEKLREALRPALAHVHRGAHSRSVALGRLSVNAHRWSQRLLADLFRENWRRGRDVEAVEAWLDTVGDGVRCRSQCLRREGIHRPVGRRTPRLAVACRPRTACGRASSGWTSDWRDPSTTRSRCCPGRTRCNGRQIHRHGPVESPQGVGQRVLAGGREELATSPTVFRSLSVLRPAAERWSERERQFDEFDARVDPRGEAGRVHDALFRRVETRCAVRHPLCCRLALALHAGETPTPLQDPLGDAAIRIVDDGEQWTLSSGHGVLQVTRVRREALAVGPRRARREVRCAVRPLAL